MGVKVAQRNKYVGKDRQGKPVYKVDKAWWVFINQKGRRKAVKVGLEAAAIKAAKKMEEGFATGVVLPVPRTKVLFSDRSRSASSSG